MGPARIETTGNHSRRNPSEQHCPEASAQAQAPTAKRNDMRGQPSLALLVSVGTRRPKKAQCRKQKRDQGGKPPASTIQAVETVGSDPIWRGRFILDICCEPLEWTECENPD